MLIKTMPWQIYSQIISRIPYKTLLFSNCIGGTQWWLFKYANNVTLYQVWKIFIVFSSDNIISLFHVWKNSSNFPCPTCVNYIIIKSSLILVFNQLMKRILFKYKNKQSFWFKKRLSFLFLENAGTHQNAFAWRDCGQI